MPRMGMNYYKVYFEGKICCFKSSQDKGLLRSILKDVEFTELITNRIDQSVHQLKVVSYKNLQLPRFKSGGEEQRGSVSVFYVETLAALANRNVPLEIFMKIYNTVWITIKTLHQHKIVIGDIRPSNIFLDMEGYPWIGDFGGFIDMSRPLQPDDIREYSSKYLPVEYQPQQREPCYMIDICCFLSTMLEIVGVSFGELETYNELVTYIKNLSPGVVRDLLMHTVEMESQNASNGVDLILKTGK